MSDRSKAILNIPNALSFYRLIVFPLVMFFALDGHERLFVIFLLISLFTDILDGYIARRFNMQTEFGARLDSIADIGTYILAVIGVICFKASDFQPHIISFAVFISLFVLSNLLALIKFRRLPSLHLYSWKIGGYMQGVFFLVLFCWGFNVYLYYIMIVWGIASFLEHIVIQLIIKEMKSNAKGLYQILKKS